MGMFNSMRKPRGFNHQYIYVDERKEKLLKNANEEAQRILREAKETADQTIRNINKLAASSGVGKELEAERTKLREKLDKVDKSLSLKNNKGPKKTISPKKLKIGDGVKVLTMNLKGTVSTLPNAHNTVIAYPYHIFKVKAFAFSHKVKNGGYPLSPMEKYGGVSLWVTAYLHDLQPFLCKCSTDV